MKQSLSEALGLSLKLLLCYLIFCIVGTVLSSAVYMIYMLCTTLVAGQSVRFFSFTLLVEGARVLFPMVLGFSSMLMAFYLTRHPTVRVLPVITLVVLTLVTWYAVLPALLSVSGKGGTEHAAREPDAALSAGFFREQDGAVLYFSDVSSAGKATGLLFDTTPDHQAVYTFTDVSAVVPVRSGFADPLIGKTVSMPPLLSYMLSWYRGLCSAASDANSRGYLSWAFFASLGLALCSVIALRNLSVWRLFSMNAIFYATAGVLACNALMVTDSVLSGASAAVAGWFRGMPFIRNPLQVLVNLVFSLAMLIVGIILRIKSKKRAQLLAEQDEGAFA